MLNIWNKGRKPIKNIHVLENIKIRIADPESKIIKFDILKVSRDSIKFQLGPDIQENTINVNFQKLEKNDGATGRIFYTGKTKSRLIATGFIEESGNIKMPKKARRASILTEHTLLVIFILITLFILNIFFWSRSRILPSSTGGRFIFEGFSVGILISLVTLILIGIILYQTFSAPNIPQGILP